MPANVWILGNRGQYIVGMAHSYKGYKVTR